MFYDIKNRDLYIEQGRTLEQYFRIVNPTDGSIYDPTAEGYNIAILQIRSAIASDGGVLILDLSTDNGGITIGNIIDGAGGVWSGYLFATADATHELVPWGDAVYDLVFIHDNGHRSTISRGRALLIPEVTLA